MDIVELLENCTAAKLEVLAISWNVPYGKKSKQKGQTLELLVEAYHNEDKVRSMLDKLDEPMKDALTCLSVVFVNSDHMTVTDAAKQLNRLQRMRGKGNELIKKLDEAGYLFIRNGWNPVISVPNPIWIGISAPLADHTAKSVRQALQIPGQVQVTESHGLAAHHDLMTVLSAIGHEAHDVSQKGHIYKRQVNRLVQSFRSSEQLFPSTDSDLPRHFAFMERFLKELGLVKLDTIAKLREDNFSLFMGANYEDWSRILYSSYVRSCYLGNGFPLSFLHSVVFRLHNAGWVDTAAAYKTLADLFDQWQLPLTETKWQLGFYSPMLAFGLIERGQTSSGAEVWRWTDLGVEFIRNSWTYGSQLPSKLKRLHSAECFVQPNLEIMVPDNVIPALRWRIEALAECMQVDKVLIFTLTKKRIMQALESGWTLASIRSLLDKYSKVPVAPNVYKTIEDWIGNYGKAELWDVMVLRIQDPEAGKWIGSSKKLAKLIIARLADDAYIVRRADEKQVRSLLEEMGYTIPSRINNPDKEEEKRKPAYAMSATERQKLEGEAITNRNLKLFGPAVLEHAADVDAVTARVLQYGASGGSYGFFDDYGDTFGYEYEEDDEYEDDYEDEDDFDFPDIDDYFDDDEDDDNAEKDLERALAELTKMLTKSPRRR
jgi:hypothetical protein